MLASMRLSMIGWCYVFALPHSEGVMGISRFKDLHFIDKHFEGMRMDRINVIKESVEEFHHFDDSGRYRLRVNIVKDVEYLLERLEKAEGWQDVSVRFQEPTGDG